MRDLEIKIQNRNGVLLVSSKIVSEQLGKRHSDVLKKIKEHLNEREFSLVEYIDKKGERRPEALLTRDGFVLLCMNYNGYNEFKRAYIEKFNEMEKELKTNPYRGFSKTQLMLEALKEQEKLNERVDALEEKIESQIRIDAYEQRVLQKIISKRVYERCEDKKNIKKYFASIYRDLKDRFGIASYRDLKNSNFEDAKIYISAWIEPAHLRER